MELSKVNKGKFHQLVPCKYEHGIWVVGSSLVRHNPISGPLSDGPQIFYSSDHWLTLLLMQDAYEEFMHTGRDTTLARFRYKFWVTQGTMLSKMEVRSWTLCQRRDQVLFSQQMGQLSLERL